MRCEPWMNKMPVRRKTPLQEARDDAIYWRQEMSNAEGRLRECEQRFIAAQKRINELSGAS